MPFRFTDEQWAALSDAIARVGGERSERVRAELEGDINRIFEHRDFDEQQVALYRRVAAAANELGDALEQLAEIGKEQAELDENFRDLILRFDVHERLKLAKQVRRCADGADWTLEKGFAAHGETARGRPADTALLSWSRKLLAIARVERWITEDERGRTSAAFMDLLIELAGCARAVGLDHTRDVRRAITRAIAMVRAEQAEEDRNRARLNGALDAVLSPEQRKAAVDPICLCGAGEKSD